MNKKIGVYWFTNDLRLHDNPLLQRAALEVDLLICIYSYPVLTPFLRQYSQQVKLGRCKQRFLDESLHSLNDSLIKLGQRLIVLDMPSSKVINILQQQVTLTHLYVDAQAGSDEQHLLTTIQAEYPALKIIQQEVRSLFSQGELPFMIEQLPNSFSQFRKKVEPIPIKLRINDVKSLPPMPVNMDFSAFKITEFKFTHDDNTAVFKGGEQAALTHCQTYFSSSHPSSYKTTRNGLDGIDYSTKFSPWLALGCISPHTIYAMLKHYEKANGSNESTYWIFFELLWREYFYWYARRYKSTLFHFAGIGNQAPLTSFYDQRFQQWQKGHTPFPIVNACMHQLNETGYISNRGRQLVASCFVHELNLDWRYGAAYFETQLIDYDVASNWGNWQYLAGVGADPRGCRRFNLAKQTQMYDPDLQFISKWHGVCDTPQIDIQDSVGWPIIAPDNDGDN